MGFGKNQNLNICGIRVIHTLLLKKKGDLYRFKIYFPTKRLNLMNYDNTLVDEKVF